MSEVLYRSYLPDLEVVRAKDGGDGRTVSGILVPYGKPQFIHESLTEVFPQGAFRHQLAAMHRVHYAYEHVSQGGVPVGRIHEAREDAKGLFASMRVSATVRGDELLTLIEDGVYSELSIGFRARRNRTLADGTIERAKADLTEIASVLHGAYGQGAKVLAVRSAEDDGEPVEHEPSPAPGVDEVAAARARTERAARLVAAMPMLPAAARQFA